jgi:hypothetical protein
VSTQHRSLWIWISAALAVVAAGLLIWALTQKSDADSAHADLKKSQEQVAQLQSQADKSAKLSDTVTGALKAGVGAVQSQLGLSGVDPAAAAQDLKSAVASSAQAQQAADAAATAASKAKGATAKAKAAANQAKAQAQVATAKARILADCTKAAVSSIGKAFQGGSVTAQIAALAQNFQGIAGNCKSALQGA